MDYSNTALIMFIVMVASLTLTEIFPKNRCEKNDEMDALKIALDKLEKRVKAMEIKQA